METTLKVSRFNHFLYIQEEDKYLVYNTLSNGLATVEPWLYDKLRNNSVISIDPSDSCYAPLWRELTKGNILVDADIDEVEFVRFKLQLAKFTAKTLTLTIIPTLACNLDCVYCYEGVKNSGRHLTKEDEESIMEFLRVQTQTFNYSGLHVVWYGGEPLLNVRAIDSLSKKFLAYCETKGLTYSAGVITNGTLLDKAVAHRLKEAGVQHLQISLDGPPNVHDQRRPYKNKQSGSSFHTILANIKNAYGVVPITVRVNVDKTNVEESLALIENFKTQGLLADPSRLAIYPGWVREATASCVDIGNCLKSDEFARACLDFSKELAKRGLAHGDRYPALAGYCKAVSVHSFVIEPGGMYHKCLLDVGISAKYLGDVSDAMRVNQRMLAWLQYDATEESLECRDCSFLPICGGGCPHSRINPPDNIHPDQHRNCTSWKLLIEERMKHFLSSQRLASATRPPN